MTLIRRSIASASLLGQATLYALLALTPVLFMGRP
jgi:hypothetical protein